MTERANWLRTDAVYDRYNSAASGDKLKLDREALEQHVTQVISETIGNAKAAKIQPTTDLFNFGIDSLQSSRIRLLLVRSVDIGDNELSQNVVYEYPSVAR